MRASDTFDSHVADLSGNYGTSSRIYLSIHCKQMLCNVALIFTISLSTTSM